MEHTDGLNYVNADFRRLDELLSWKFISINITEGAGVGFLVPRTDASLLNFDRNDKFHIAGYGLNAMLGLNIRFGKNFFIQSEYKMGYISMQDIRTSKYKEDIASQRFLFHQYNVVFGSHFRL